MARLTLVALFGAAVLVNCASAMTFTELGMSMSSRAYDLVCWYENLKQFPKTNSNAFMQCIGQAENVKKQIVDQMNDDDSQQRYFGDWMESLAMGELPEEYMSSCGSYLKDAKKSPPADESDALNDGQDKPYPYQGFAYCMVNHIRGKFGEGAISAIKEEKTHKKKHWMSTILDRDNEFRARHDAKPLGLIKDLNEQAQRWADKLAAECNMYHSKNDYPDRQWNGAGTGESLSGGGGTLLKEDSAYVASDGWYEEVQDYPYPAYRGSGNDGLFKKIGHFTQSVWKGTKYVGYGYAYNPDCSGFTWYVVARYSPAGNMRGAYGENVGPPN